MTRGIRSMRKGERVRVRGCRREGQREVVRERGSE